MHINAIFYNTMTACEAVKRWTFGLRSEFYRFFGEERKNGCCIHHVIRMECEGEMQNKEAFLISLFSLIDS